MTIGAQSIDAFLESLGQKTPTPGGGAVAGVTAAIGAALGRMVVSYSLGKTSLAEHADRHADAMAALEQFQRRMIELADDDAEAYLALNELSRLDPDDERRQREYEPALLRAITVPLEVMTAGTETLERLESLRGRTNKWLFSDLAIAAILIEAAVRSAAWNVRINLPNISDDAFDKEVRGKLDGLLRGAEEAAREVKGFVEAAL